MMSRSDASPGSPAGPLAEGDRDVLAINGHHFDLGGPATPGGSPA